jgi:uncharacterized lipoprotein YddW (UPF0748 family)
VFVVFVLGMLMFAAAVSSGTGDPREVRGLWVVRDSLVTPEQVRLVVEFADSLRFNMLFVQVRGRGDAYYRSKLVPGPEEHPEIPDSFDPLASIIRLAHSRGIEVHAWFNVNPVWSARMPPSSPRHVVRTHPEWLMVSRSGLGTARCSIDSVVNHAMEGRYLSPGIQQVRKHLARIVRELVRRYDVDGVHLDYVRYPGWNYDFRGEILREFRNRHGIDPRDVTGGGRPKADPESALLLKWVRYRADLMSGLVGEIAREVRRVDRRIRISAAVKPDPADALYEFGQDWPTWLREGTVDFVVTMSYFSREDAFRESLLESLGNADPRKVVAGIAMHLAPPSTAEEQVARVREAGLLGFCVFSYGASREQPARADTLKRIIGGKRAELPPEYTPHTRKTK